MIRPALNRLKEACDSFREENPGKPLARQPVHTVYGGAHLFKAETVQKLGRLAKSSLDDYAPNFGIFAKALGLPGSESLPVNNQEAAALAEEIAEQTPSGAGFSNWLAWRVYTQVRKKLDREAVEDFRLDYEDGFGIRPDEEEDAIAVQGAREMALGLNLGSLPSFIGIRVKPFNQEFYARGVRTLDLFLGTLLAETTSRLPDNFVVTLPKVEIPEQASTMVELFKVIEKKSGLAPGSLKMEIMVETPQSLFDGKGAAPLRRIVDAAEGRCIGAHFGAYDYTAACDLTATFQRFDSPVSDFARNVMKVAFSGSGICLSDGATNIMPVGPHRGKNPTPRQVRENTETVHNAWKTVYTHIRHSLEQGFYQGWDLHPAQIPVRYAANAVFFLEQLEESSLRLKNFVEQSSKATLSGDVFDDAATAQGLLNFFRRALNSGAIDPGDMEVAGVSVEEVRVGSFRKIVESRRG